MAIDKEFRIEIKVHNNLLIRAREREGLSCTMAANKIGVSYELLRHYELLKISPLSARSGAYWKSSAVQIATYYGYVPDYFWPDTVLSVKTPRIVRELSVDEAKCLTFYKHRALPTPEEVVEKQELHDAISIVLEGLDTLLGLRNASIIRKRYGLGCDPLTLLEISKEFGISAARVGTVEIESLSKMKRSNIKLLKPFLEN